MVIAMIFPHPVLVVKTPTASTLNARGFASVGKCLKMQVMPTIDCVLQ
jgi:hypothetical protein